MSTTIKPMSIIRAVWQGDHRFEAGRAGAPPAHLDGSAVTGQSPTDALLSALAVCSAIDVVDILAKRRTPVTTLEVDVVGERRDAPPRRFLAIDLTFHIVGEPVERVHAERAVSLSLERYCSVASSLAPDIVMRAAVTLNGQPGELRPQHVGR